MTNCYVEKWLLEQANSRQVFEEEEEKEGEMDTNEPTAEEFVSIFNNRKPVNGTQSSVSPSSNLIVHVPHVPHVPVCMAVTTPG